MEMHNFEEELTCSICYNIFEDPRVLSCSHTFCRHCLESVVGTSENFSIWRPLRLPLKCPNCRSVVELPPAGVASLPINFPLRAIIEKYNKDDHPDVVTCMEHYRQPLNVYCLKDRKLVCGHCLTIGEHQGHPIDDIQSAYTKEKETPGKLLELLNDKYLTGVCLLIEKLEQQKSYCESTVEEDKKVTVHYFEKLNTTMEHQKRTFLAALDEVNNRISEKYMPLIEKMKEIRREQLELTSLSSSVQEEESPLVFLERIHDVRQRVKALKRQKLLEIQPAEVYPRMGGLLKEWSKMELGQINKILKPRIRLCSKGRVFNTMNEKKNRLIQKLFTFLKPILTVQFVVLSVALIMISLKSNIVSLALNEIMPIYLAEAVQMAHYYMGNSLQNLQTFLFHISDSLCEWMQIISFNL
ncbi:tripartite motif-containing protein 59 [Rhinatrema bivittatum]|uniref:tripartite motif-containing protein 59 n=1 Tax=Rhinatrema bivittatum TaxID=194408 RepID=UPI00112C4E50|nr:tripartite motif-containing protein 59 [Rhinatrema bivittatum]